MKLTATSSAINSKARPQRDWTVLFYMNGQGDADQRICQRMLDLEQTGSSDRVSILAQVARLPQSNLERIEGSNYKPSNLDGDWSGARRYLVTKSNQKSTNTFCSPVLQDVGPVDMASGSTLADFLAWGIKNYPAKNYAVVMCGHGGAWQGSMFENSSDPTAAVKMSPKELDSALAVAATVAGKPVDNLDLMACGMSSAEFASQVAGHAGFLAGSEEISYANSYPYNPVLDKLQDASRKGEPLSPLQLAQAQVTEFQSGSAFNTRSAIDLEKMPTVEAALKKVSSLILVDPDPHKFRGDLAASQAFGRNVKHPLFSRLRDLGDLAVHLGKETGASPELREASVSLAQAVKEAVVAQYSKPYTRVETLSKTQTADEETLTTQQVYSGNYRATGLSIYAPADLDKVEPGYMYTQLAVDTGWDQALNRILSPVPANATT